MRSIVLQTQFPLYNIRFRYILMLLIGLVMADGFVTQYLINSGIAWESNPILRHLLSDGSLMPVKFGSSLLSAFLLASINIKQPKTARITSWWFIVIYTLIVYWNIVVLIIGFRFLS